jgi:hypothetical protein
VIVYYVLSYLNTYFGSFSLQIDLLYDLIKVEPKVQPAKVNTHGARLKDFDDARVREEYIKQSQMSHFDFDPNNKLNHTM